MSDKSYFDKLRKKKSDRVQVAKDNSEESFKEMLDMKEEAEDMEPEDLRDDVKSMREKEKALMKMSFNNKKKK